MPIADEATLRAALVSLAKGCDWMSDCLRTAQELRLASWCIGAGAVRTMVWDSLHGFRSPSTLPDVDLVYFDRNDTSPEQDEHLRQRLSRILPDVPWEVTNQAGVHLWYEREFGHAVPALESLSEGVSTWPEFATCVGLTANDDNSLSVIAPHGLGDLFEMVVRRNPVRATVANFLERVASKRYSERWPLVKVEPC